jgi:hypothetical protein
MPWVLDSLPNTTREQLLIPLRSPCLDEDHRIYEQLRTQLNLNPLKSFDQMLKPTSRDCLRPTTALEILAQGFVDDPDQGMDQDLPEAQAADPTNDRKWMGGKTGPTSQGFRHMFFGGWKPMHPVETIQIPLHAVGKAPDRAQVMADRAAAFFPETHSNLQVDEAWGWRVISWELHYLQDLAQPFHSVQILSFGMLPWNSLFKDLFHFDEFVTETTRTVGNYHLAYEGLVLAELSLAEKSPLKDCLGDASTTATLAPERVGFPGTANFKALQVSHASIGLADSFSRALMRFFGPQLKNAGVDLSQHQSVPDYALLAQSETAEHRDLDRESCHAVANAVEVSRRVLVEAAARFSKP